MILKGGHSSKCVVINPNPVVIFDPEKRNVLYGYMLHVSVQQHTSFPWRVHPISV